jgi:hypothetical protein
MELDAFVPGQAVAIPTFVIAVGLGCGHKAGVPLLIATLAATTIWLALALVRAVRTRGRPAREPSERSRAFAIGAIGFLLPSIGAAALSLAKHFDGLLSNSEAALFGGVSFVVIWVVILVSSMIDRYLILPFCLGELGPPIWSLGADPSIHRRRRFAKLWVAHRAICEICAYTALAILLAIIFVALGNAVSHERVLAVALESLSGSGVAFTVLAYLGPRVRDSWNYMMGDNAGLGSWAEGIDITGERVEGFLVDVSVHPGIKLYTADDQWRFVKLGDAPKLHEAPLRRPTACDERWAERAVLMRQEAKPHAQPASDGSSPSPSADLRRFEAPLAAEQADS